MKAIVVHEAGGPENLRLEEVPDPTPGVGDLLVAVERAGLNYIDTYHRGGLYPMEFPIIPGVEGAGVVIEVGERVDDFVVGDRVGWTGLIGSYATRHLVPASVAIPIPDEIGSDTAAAVLLQGITAQYLATDTFPLSASDRCLIHAGAGGVGLLLTQIARGKGAYVITTVGSEEKVELSRGAGADEVIDYTSTDFKEAVEELVGPHELDVVYDGVGRTTFERSMDLLRPRGMMVAFGNASGPPPDISPLVLAEKGSLFLTRPTLAHYLRTREERLGRANEVMGLVASGDLQVLISAVFPLAEAPAAHEALEGRKTTGKVLIAP